MEAKPYTQLMNESGLQILFKAEPGAWFYAQEGEIVATTNFLDKCWIWITDIFAQKSSVQQVCEIAEEKLQSCAAGMSTESLRSTNHNYLDQKPGLKFSCRRLNAVGVRLPTLEALAKCPEIVEAQLALRQKILPEKNEQGIQCSYKMLDRNRAPLAIFKAKELEYEELFGIRAGELYLRERGAYLLDKHSTKAGIPLTKITSFSRNYFPGFDFDTGSFTGSFQLWQEGLRKPLELFKLDKIPEGEMHRMAMFDLRFLNADRHTGNMLVGTNRLVPIDHGYILPGDLWFLRFDWVNLSSAKTPFSEEELAYIRNIDTEKDIAYIRKKMPSVTKETLRAVQVSTMLLQIAAEKGMTPAEIAQFMMGRKHEDWLARNLNRMIAIPSGNESHFSKEIMGKITADATDEKIRDFLSRILEEQMMANAKAKKPKQKAKMVLREARGLVSELTTKD